MLDNVVERHCLPVGQRVLPHQDILADRPLSPRLHLIKLSCQP